MVKGLVTTSALLGGLAFGACTVHQSEMPSLTGPSQLAMSLSVTATPDSISQDGASQSTIKVTAVDATGKLAPNVPIRLDMVVASNGAPVVQDFGTLSARNVVTGNDGTATAIYTAPVPPPPLSSPPASGANIVSIRATPSGSNAAVTASSQQAVAIRLVPPGVILPPAGTPKASFVVTPPPQLNVSANFDASASCPTTDSSGNCVLPFVGSLVYAWSFGDGSTGGGVKTTHAYSSLGTFSVTLTVTNDRGVQASTTQQVAVIASAVPTATFVVSPTAPVIGQTVFFNGSGSRAAPGHSIVQWTWDFGDGTTVYDPVNTSHIYSQQGSYTAVLTVTDDTNQQGTFSIVLIIGSGNPVAAFTVSPGTPTHGFPANFDGSNSQAFGGATIVDYQWNFGDGTTVDSGLVSTTSHPFTQSSVGAGFANGYPVTLTVVDSKGRRNSITVSIVVN